jgi:hypothetical protein
LVGLIYVAVVLVEIFLVGSVLVALTTWPLWRRLRKLERERDAKAREILERWSAGRPARAELSSSTMRWFHDRGYNSAVVSPASHARSTASC